MLIEQAKVIAYQNGFATVQCIAKSGCGGCAGRSACGTRALSGLAGEKTAPQLTLAVDQVLSEGDWIEIGLAESSLLFSVFWLYIVPLFALIASTLLLSYWIEQELWVALGVLLVTTGTFISIKTVMLRNLSGQFTPQFLRKL